MQKMRQGASLLDFFLFFFLNLYVRSKQVVSTFTLIYFWQVSTWTYNKNKLDNISDCWSRAKKNTLLSRNAGDEKILHLGGCQFFAINLTEIFKESFFCVSYIFASLFCISKREHLWNKEKCFFISLWKIFLFSR